MYYFLYLYQAEEKARPKSQLSFETGVRFRLHSRYHSNCGQLSATSSKSNSFYAFTQHSREAPTWS